MNKCINCGSTEIINTEDYFAYFREGDMLRQRVISVYQNLNNEPKGYIASCQELSQTTTAIGETELEAINNLGMLLKEMFKVELLGKKID